MSRTIQPRLGTVVTMIVAILFLFLLFSQAGKYHETGFIVEKAEERHALNQERKKAMLYIGVNDDIALKVKPIKIPLASAPARTKQLAPKQQTVKTTDTTQDPNIRTALSVAQRKYESSDNSQNKSTGSRRKSKYTVKQGDTLFGIAQKVYGDGNKWRTILKGNKSLSNPNNLRSGMKLLIPEPTSNNTAYLKWQNSLKKNG